MGENPRKNLFDNNSLQKWIFYGVTTLLTHYGLYVPKPLTFFTYKICMNIKEEGI
jgi:hypothetical protein